MSLTQFLRILWARRMVVLVCTLSALIGAFIVSQLLPERYQAESRLVLDVKPDPVTGEVIGTAFARAYTKTQIELVRDPRVAEYAVNSLKLAGEPSLQDEFQKAGGAGDFNRWLVSWVAERTESRFVEGSNVLEIIFTAHSPQLASRLANALRDGFVNASIASRREGAGQTAEWYRQQTDKARLALQQAEKTKTDFERRTGLILEGGSDVDSVRLAALAGAPPPAPGGAVGAVAPVVSTPSGTQLAQVDAAIAQASQALGPNHPEMQELQRRRVALAGLAAQERAAAGAAANANASAASRSASAGASAASQAYQAQRSRVIGQRGELEQLRRLQTEIDVRREQYAKTAARAAELRQQAEISDAGLTPLGAAETPGAPVSPNRPLILLGAFGFGLAFGILLALLLELLNRRVRGIEDMASLGEVPLLAVISSTGERPADQPRLGWSGRA